MPAAERIRVGHIVGWLHFGGRENGVVNLVNSLDPNVFDSHIFSFVRDGSLTARVIPGRCKIIEFGEKLGGDYRLYFKLARAFRSYRIHIAHTHGWGTLLEGMVAAKLARVPAVVHGEHGTIKDDTKAHIYLQRLMWHAADEILSVSEALRRKLAQTIHFPENHIRVIANGVDLRRFTVARDRSAWKFRLNLPPDALTFGTVGRFVPVKCYPVLLEASRWIFERIPNSYLVLVGDGPLRNQLAQLAQDYKIRDRVRFLGWRSDVPEILNALDTYVLASESEGMSNTILEAMACGLPVVATSVGGNAELVDRAWGLLVPPYNPKILADAISFLLGAPGKRETMGRLARQRVEEHFSVEVMAQNYARVYLEVVSRRIRLSGSLHERIRNQRVTA
ncbi:MAG TPA: glycosyltransferase [Candidatus Binatia bacterium]|nr:glycosyltransferase [Candidatus Binatia bacterium]